MSVWLQIVGIGEDGLAGLAPAARAAVDNAEVLVGGERHLAMLPIDGRERLLWPSPLAEFVEQIQAHRARRVCVLATGDPFNFGVGVTLARHVPCSEIRIFPSPSAFALACARMGWDRNAVDTLSVHGRPLSKLRGYLHADARLLVLAHDRTTPAEVARILVDAGYAASRINVLEHMGGAHERCRSAIAEHFDLDDCADFNTLAIECVAAPGTMRLPRAAGLPDDAFEHDGQITKRVVRAATLAALAPLPGELLWDVGAGCGAVAVEWMRSHPRNAAVAIERRADRAAMCARNAQALGVPELRIEQGEALAQLHGLPAPHAVFIGGGVTIDGLFEQCWSALRPHGRLVANAVTLEAEQILTTLHRQYARENGGELLRIAVSHAASLGAFHGMRPAMPVTQLTLIKPFAGDSAQGEAR